MKIIWGLLARLILVLFVISCNFVILADNITVPPELAWWFDEIRKEVPDFDTSFFSKTSEETHQLDSDGYLCDDIYPIFMRWNFSGDKIAYFNLGSELTREDNGLYRIYHDVDSAVMILSKDKKLLFIDRFGSFSGIDGICWLTDNILVGVGKEIDVEKHDKEICFIIKQYKISDKTIRVTIYKTNNILSNEQRLKLRLNWYEQRRDYFIVE